MKLPLVIAPLAVVLLAGCGEAPAASPDAGNASPTGASADIGCLPGQAQADASVRVIDFAFEPGEIAISTGQSIAWTNEGDAPHTVTFNDGPSCGRLAAGESLAAELSTAGEFAYHCAIHPTMRGTVVVGP